MVLLSLLSVLRADDGLWTAGALLDVAGGPQVEAADVGDSTATYLAALGSYNRFDSGQTVGLHALAGYSVLGLFRLDADLELAPWSENGASDLGDVRVGATVPFIRQDAVPWRVGLDLGAGLPAGAPETFTTGGVDGRGALLLGYRGQRAFLDTQVGAELFPLGRVTGIGGIGAGLSIHRLARVGLELDGELRDGALQPLELHGYGVLGTTNGFTGMLGAGGALLTGPGAANFRALLMLAYRYPGVELGEDRDGDGNDDEIDACPEEAEDRDGALDADGCPDDDNDQDGVADPVDSCRNQPEDLDGFQDVDGCPDPDNDRDGVVDPNDQCPIAAGPAHLQGCPDRDEDGLADADDWCPEARGPRSTRGCPDRDADGVADRRDACPDEPKDPLEDPGTSDGCLRRVVVTADRIKFNEPIFFAYNAATILPESGALMAEIGAIIQKNSQITLIEIGGHTDGDGSEAYNLDLSSRRADAVRQWLIDKEGVSPARLVARGYGETRPVESNETEDGKAKNRRVDLVIVTKDAPSER